MTNKDEAYIVIGIESDSRQYHHFRQSVIEDGEGKRSVRFFGHGIEIGCFTINSTVDSLIKKKEIIQIYKSEEEAQKAARVKTYTEGNKVEVVTRDEMEPPIEYKMTYMPVKVGIDFSLMTEQEQSLMKEQGQINSANLVRYSMGARPLCNEKGAIDVGVNYSSLM